MVDVGQHVVDVASRFQGHEGFLFALERLVVLLLVWADRGRVVRQERRAVHGSAARQGSLLLASAQLKSLFLLGRCSALAQVRLLASDGSWIVVSERNNGLVLVHGQRCLASLLLDRVDHQVLSVGVAELTGLCLECSLLVCDHGLNHAVVVGVIDRVLVGSDCGQVLRRVALIEEHFQVERGARGLVLRSLVQIRLFHVVKLDQVFVQAAILVRLGVNIVIRRVLLHLPLRLAKECSMRSNDLIVAI